MRCEAELCHRWTGSGCICGVLDLEPDVDKPWRDPWADDTDEDDEGDEFDDAD